MKFTLIAIFVLLGYFVLANNAYALPPKPNLPSGPTAPKVPQLPSQPDLPPLPSCPSGVCQTPVPSATPLATISPTPASTGSGSSSSSSSSSGSSSGSDARGGQGEVLALSGTSGNLISFVTVLGIVCLTLGIRLTFSQGLKRG